MRMKCGGWVVREAWVRRSGCDKKGVDDGDIDGRIRGIHLFAFRFGDIRELRRSDKIPRDAITAGCEHLI